METREKPTGSVMGTKAVGAGASPSRLMAIRCSRAALLLSSLRRAPPTPADGPDPQEASERWRRWAVASWAALARERRERKQLERLGELEVILLAVLLTCFVSALYSHYLGLL